jgi:hypothetical protein
MNDQHAQDPVHQHERADDLRDDVQRVVTDGRPGREHRELQARVLRFLEVVPIGGHNQRGADEGADELPDQVLRDIAAVSDAGDPEANGDRGVEVGAGELVD